MLVQQFIHDLATVPEFCAPDPFEGIGEVQEAALGRQLQDSKRADNSKSLVASVLYSLTVIHHQKVGSK